MGNVQVNCYNKNMDNAHMNNPVKDVRKALGLTQMEMAEKLGCSYMTARRCEYSGKMPQTKAVQERLRKLAKQAGVQLEEAGK
jgi:transcriptional regulator with XRE-family HTH domain